MSILTNKRPGCLHPSHFNSNAGECEIESSGVKNQEMKFEPETLQDIGHCHILCAATNFWH